MINSVKHSRQILHRFSDGFPNHKLEERHGKLGSNEKSHVVATKKKQELGWRYGSEASQGERRKWDV